MGEIYQVNVKPSKWRRNKGKNGEMKEIEEMKNRVFGGWVTVIKAK